MNATPKPPRTGLLGSFRPRTFVRALRERPRLLGALLLGVAVQLGIAFDGRLPGATAALIGWNAGALAYLAFAFGVVRGTDPRGICKRALRQDEGRLAILALVVLAELAVLLAVGTQLAQAKAMTGWLRAAHLSLAALTVLTSWLFTQVLFALHYAHDFYTSRVRGEGDPLTFPGTDDPNYADFVYFSCVIGAAAQTADVSFHGSSLRPIGALHCILSFFFNATLLALSINIAAGLLF